MRKLMFMLAAVCTVSIVQAASVNWTISLGKDSYANKQYYVFGGSDSTDALALLAAYDSSTSAALESLALASGTLNSKAGKASGSGLDIGSNSSLLMVVLNDSLTAGTTFIYDTMDVSSYTYEPPATPPGIFTAENANFTQNGTVVAAGGAPIPEPTSGLLMIVGLGALALRRRKA